ncbi:hypothetical protein CHRYSEO8AT_640001 [Chryseobacterium sp. 8AT]|nr:hypothetical protein CHRYSEO8AT_640001 [Chryseobacterium sp. 8AT]
MVFEIFILLLVYRYIAIIITAYIDINDWYVKINKIFYTYNMIKYIRSF